MNNIVVAIVVSSSIFCVLAAPNQVGLAELGEQVIKLIQIQNEWIFNSICLSKWITE